MALQRGSSGSQVAALQQFMNDLAHVTGCNQIADDGIFGPLTEDSVKCFQYFYGLPVTGVLDDATAKMLGLDPTNPAPKRPSGSDQKQNPSLPSDKAGDPPPSMSASTGYAVVGGLLLLAFGWDLFRKKF